MTVPRKGLMLLACGVCVVAYAGIAMMHGSALCPYTPDSLWYADVARFLARGDGLRCNITMASDFTPLPRPFYGWPPLYPAAGAAVMRLGVTPLMAMRAVSIGAFALLPIPLLRVGARLWGILPAMAATLWVPLWPTMFTLSAQALSEPLFLFLLALTLDTLVRTADTVGRPIRAGLTLGLAGLTRLAGAVFVPALAISLVWSRDHSRWKDAIFAVGAFMATAGLWVARNSLATGGPSGIEEPAQAIPLMPVITACVQRVLWEMTSVGVVGGAAALHWKAVVPVLGLLTVLLGFYRIPGTRILALWGAAYLVGIAWLRTQGPFDSPSGGRTLAPTLMIMAFWLAGNLWHAALGPQKPPRKIMAGVLAAALTIGLLLGRAQDVRAARTTPPSCPLTACQTPGLVLLDAMSAPGEAVLSNVAFKTAYCQDRPSVQLPIRPYSTLRLDPGVVASVARFHSARLIYVEEASIRGAHGHDPLVFALLRGEEVAGLRRIAVDETGSLYEVIIAAE